MKSYMHIIYELETFIHFKAKKCEKYGEIVRGIKIQNSGKYFIIIKSDDNFSFNILYDVMFDI